jgi:hypothetical protein
VLAGDTGGTGDTGAPCGPPPAVSVVVDPPAGEAGITLHGATVTASGGLAPLEVEIDWGDGTVRAFGPSPSDVHTYATDDTFTVVASVRDACGSIGVATSPVVVSAAGALLEVTASADESDAEVFGGPWLGTGLSLREAMTLSQSEPGRQVVTFAPGLGVAFVGAGLPALFDPAGTRLAGRPDVVVDGSAGGQLSITGADAELVGLRLRDFTTATGAIRLAAGSTGAKVIGGAIEDCALALRIDVAAEVTGMVLTGNGTGGLPQVEVWAPATLSGLVVADGANGGISVASGGSGARIVGTVVRGNAWGVHLNNGGGGADDVVLTDDTIVGNVGQGLWLESQVGGVALQNSIVAFNGTGIDGSDLQFALLDDDLFYGNATDCTACTPGPATLYADPLFTDLAGGDVSLVEGSPAVNVGVVTGHDRNGGLPGDWNGSGPDLGAVESSW